MFALDAKLLCLDVDIDIVDLVNAALGLGLLKDPVAKSVVNSVATAFLVLILTLSTSTSKDQLLAELAGKLTLACLYSLLGHVHSPLIILDLGRSVDDLRSSVDFASEFVITADIVLIIVVVLAISLVGAVLGTVISSTAATVVLAAILESLLLGFASGLAFGLVLLAALLGGLVLDDVATQFVAKVDISTLAAGLAVENDGAVLDVDVGLRVLALSAENKLVDEAIEIVLELGCVVGTVDDPAIISRVNIGLSTELEAEVLDEIVGRAGQRLGHAAEVDDDGLDAVTFAFNLGLELLHLVTVEGVGDIATNVDGSHDCGLRFVRMAQG